MPARTEIENTEQTKITKQTKFFAGISLVSLFSFVPYSLKIIIICIALVLFLSSSNSGQEIKKLDPAGWGGNHVGGPVPEFVQGDECLFCHRNEIGVTWQKNAHGIAVRSREDAPELAEVLKSNLAMATTAAQIEYFLGSRHRVRFLKKIGYGKFALLNTQVVLATGEKGGKKATAWKDAAKPAWDNDKFADSCTGCHSTGVDPETKAFSNFGLDCYVCHGNVDLNHTKDTALVLLSKKNRTAARTITSLCAQCHLRGGKSRSTGLPYPNNFIAGDNLFQDFTVDWTKADDEKVNAGDRHVWRNVRDVAVDGSNMSCLSCHQVHANSSFKHRRQPKSPICSECHNESSYKDLKKYIVNSALCEY